METEAQAEIRAVRYEEGRQRLVVRFTDGGEYAFVGVPGDVHRSFVDAPEKARFFSERIQGQFPYNKLT